LAAGAASHNVKFSPNKMVGQRLRPQRRQLRTALLASAFALNGLSRAIQTNHKHRQHGSRKRPVSNSARTTPANASKR
jgi:hypothetical protein